MDSQSKSGSCTDQELVDVGDGYLYRALTLEEALDLCQDVQLYITWGPASNACMRERVPTPEVFRGESGYWMNNLRDWYRDTGLQYARLDPSKPEYEPA
mgnify:CR=1 FL=1